MCRYLVAALPLLASWIPVGSAQLRPHRLEIKLPVTDRNDIRFTHVSAEQGLSQSRIGQIVQDQRGFLWFGTQDGLKRYDGYRFREYRHDPGNPDSLSGSSVRALYRDHSGTLWVASDLYLDRYDPEREVFIHHKFETGQLQGPVTHIGQDRDGFLWLATNDGLTRMSPETWRTVHYEHTPGDPGSLSSRLVRGTFEEKDGTFWVATTEDLDIFDRQTGRIVRQFPTRPFFSSAPSRIIFLQDHTGALWVAASSGRGVIVVDRHANQITEYPITGSSPGRIRMTGVLAMYEDQDGVLWLGTDGYGLLKLDRNRKEFSRYRSNPDHPDGINTDFVATLLEDLKGNMWVGTVGAGVDRFARRPLAFRRYRYDSSNQASSVYQDSRGTVWVGSPKGLSQIDSDKMQLLYYKGSGWPAELVRAYVISTVEDRFGRLWFGTVNRGLFCMDRRTGQVQVYHNDPTDPDTLGDNKVNTLFVDRNGTVWAATEHGLSAFDPLNRHFRVYRAGEGELSRYHSISEDPEGRLWISTWHAGIQLFNPVTGKFTVFRRDPARIGSLSSDLVNTIALDHTGTVWVGTPSGLSHFDPARGTFRTYTDHDGLPNNNVIGVAEDDAGDLWIGTSYGLSRFNIASQRFYNYNEADGILGNEFDGFNVAWKGRDGELFFCSYAGITAFFPAQIAEKPYKPPIVISDFQLFGKPAAIGGKSPLKVSMPFTRSLTLSHTQDIFSLEFLALNYSDPARDHYRYRLDGLEPEWNQTDGRRRIATYTTLSPRTYLFRVQYRSERGDWDEEGATLSIRVLPPWWNTWQFGTLLFAFFVLSTWFLFRIRLHQLAREFNARLEGRVDERVRVARELHDTLLQSFQGSLLVMQTARNTLSRRPEQAGETLDNAIDMASDAITEGRDAIQNLRLQPRVQSDLGQLLTTTGQELARSPGTIGNAVMFQVTIEGERCDLEPVLQDEVYRIGREVLRNAFRHAQAKQIEVEIRYDARLLRLRIRDDGKGIDGKVMQSGAREGHWGLPGMRERAEQIGAQMVTWSEIGAGTEVELTVPARIAYAKSRGRRRIELFRKRGGAS